VVPQADFGPFFADRHHRENGGQGNTPAGSGGVNREIEEAEATGVESAPSEPCRCAIAGPDPGLPSVSLTRSALAIAT
jgi:hypothetical protein